MPSLIVSNASICYLKMQIHLSVMTARVYGHLDVALPFHSRVEQVAFLQEFCLRGNDNLHPWREGMGGMTAKVAPEAILWKTEVCMSCALSHSTVQIVSVVWEDCHEEGSRSCVLGVHLGKGHPTLGEMNLTHHASKQGLARELPAAWSYTEQGSSSLSDLIQSICCCFLTNEPALY